MPRLRHTVAFLAALALTGVACAQPSNVNSAGKFAWGENVGWINFRDAGSPVAAAGVRVDADILSGFAWGENTGWINFGDGSPGTVTGYGNTSGADFGVNRNTSTGNLSGLAWGENVGWINFGWALASDVSRPRIEGGRLKGFAWGENIGWINLDLTVAGQFVVIDLPVIPSCLADVAGGGNGTVPDPDGTVDGSDFVAFINSFAIGDVNIDPLADVAGGGSGNIPDPDGTIDGTDFVAFINAFALGC